MRQLMGVAALLLAGCDDTLFATSGGEISAEGYEGVVQISEANCLACHSAGSKLGDLDLETDLHAATVGVEGAYGTPIVTAGDPATSMFYLKITATQGSSEGTEMPPGSGGLDASLADVVEAWILDGAPAE